MRNGINLLILAETLHFMANNFNFYWRFHLLYLIKCISIHFHQAFLYDKKLSNFAKVKNLQN